MCFFIFTETLVVDIRDWLSSLLCIRTLLLPNCFTCCQTILCVNVDFGIAVNPMEFVISPHTLLFVVWSGGLSRSRECVYWQVKYYTGYVSRYIVAPVIFLSQASDFCGGICSCPKISTCSLNSTVLYLSGRFGGQNTRISPQITSPYLSSSLAKKKIIIWKSTPAPNISKEKKIGWYFFFYWPRAL